MKVDLSLWGKMFQTVGVDIGGVHKKGSCTLVLACSKVPIVQLHWEISVLDLRKWGKNVS